MLEKNIQLVRYTQLPDDFYEPPPPIQSAPKKRIWRQKSRINFIIKVRPLALFFFKKFPLVSRKNYSVKLNKVSENPLGEPKLLSMRQIEVSKALDKGLVSFYKSSRPPREISVYNVFRGLGAEPLHMRMFETEKAQKIVFLTKELEATQEIAMQRKIKYKLSKLFGSLNDDLSLDRLHARSLYKQRKTFNRKTMLTILDRLAASVKLQQLVRIKGRDFEDSNSKLERIFNELVSLARQFNIETDEPLSESELIKMEAVFQDIEGRLNNKGLNALAAVFLNEIHLLIRHFRQYELPRLGAVASSSKESIRKAFQQDGLDEKPYRLKSKLIYFNKKVKVCGNLIKAQQAEKKETTAFEKCINDYLPFLERFEFGVEDSSNPENHSFSREGVVQMLDRLEVLFCIQQCSNDSKRFQDKQKNILSKLDTLKALINLGNFKSSLLNLQEVSRLVIEFKKLYKGEKNPDIRALLKSLYIEFMAGWADMARNEGHKQLLEEYGYLSRIGSKRIKYTSIGVSSDFNSLAVGAKLDFSVKKTDFLALDEQGLTFHANDKSFEVSAKLTFGSNSSLPFVQWMRLKLNLSLSRSIPRNIVFKLPGMKKAIYKKKLVNNNIDILSRFTERKSMADELYHDVYKDYATRFNYWFSPEAALSKVKRYVAPSKSSVIHHDKHIQRAINNKQNFREQLARMLHIANLNKKETLKSLLDQELHLTFPGPYHEFRRSTKETITLLNTNVDYEQPLHAVYKKITGSAEGSVSCIKGSIEFANYDAEQVVFVDFWEKVSSQYASIKSLSGGDPGVADHLLRLAENDWRSKVPNSTQNKYMTANRIIEDAKNYLFMVDRFNNPLVDEEEKVKLSLAIYACENDWCASHDYALYNYLSNSEGVPSHLLDDVNMIEDRIKGSLLAGLGRNENLVNTLTTMIMAYKINLDSLSEQDRISPDFKLIANKFDSLLRHRSEKIPDMLLHDHLDAFFKEMEELQSDAVSGSELSAKKTFHCLQLNQAKKNLEKLSVEDDKQCDALSDIQNAYTALVRLSESFEHYINLLKQRDSGKRVAETQLILDRIQSEFLAGKDVVSECQVADAISAMVFANAEIGLRLLKAYEDDPLLNNNPAYLRAKAQVGKNATLFEKPSVDLNKKYFQLKSQYALSGRATIEDKEASIHLQDSSGLVSAVGTVKLRNRPEHPNPLRKGELLSVNLTLKAEDSLISGMDKIGYAIQKLVGSNEDAINKKIADISGDQTESPGFLSVVNNVLNNDKFSMDSEFEAGGILNFEAIKPALYEEEAFLEGRKNAVAYALKRGWIEGDLDDLLAKHTIPKGEWAYFRAKKFIGGSVTAKVPTDMVSPVAKVGVQSTHVVYEKLFANSLAYVVRDLAHVIAHYEGEEQVEQMNKRINDGYLLDDDGNILKDADGNPLVKIKDDYMEIFLAMHRPEVCGSKPFKKDLHFDPSQVWYELFGYLNLIETDLKEEFKLNMEAVVNRETTLRVLDEPLKSPLEDISEDKSISDYFKCFSDWLVNNDLNIEDPVIINKLVPTLVSIMNYQYLKNQFFEFWEGRFDRGNQVGVQKARNLLIELVALVRPVINKKAQAFLEPIAVDQFPVTHSDIDRRRDPKSLPRIDYKQNVLRV